MSRFTRFAAALLGFSAVTFLSGCSGISSIAPSTPVSGFALKGVVHGGQQPVTSATITLWAVGTTGDGSSASVLTTTASNSSGNFTLGTYTCPGGDPDVYLTASGGNPGLTGGTNNTAILMIAALTDCNTLKANAATTFVWIDEVTTVGTVAALYPYMTSSSNLSYGSSDAAAFATAFSSVSEYTNTTSGTAPGPTLPSGYYASSTEINTLGNIIASCINSIGGSAGDNSPCGNLFNLTKSGTTAPTTTLGAMLNILNNPTQNVSALFSLPQPITPFQPVDSVAPSSWALPILQMAATPTFSPVGGSYGSAQFVTISDATSGAVIHYTTDGSTPTSASPIYSASSGAITVSSSETLNAIAQAGGYATSAVGSASYTMTGSTSTYSVGGQLTLNNNCNSSALPAITLTLTNGTTVVQTTSSTGNFAFNGVPNGTYTITPSLSGPAAEFYPSTQTVSVGNNNVSNANFNLALGYTVSGTVAYSGSQTGQTYLVLNNNKCGGGGTYGTSISTKGTYTIRGVQPGSYTLQAFMDNLGIGSANASNPAGSTSVMVGTQNYTGANVTLADPATVTLSSAPNLQGVGGFNNGLIAQYTPITNSNGIETPTSYTLQWSSTQSPFTVVGSQTFPANGTHTGVWFSNNAVNPSLTTGTTPPTYYFRATAASAGTAAGTYYSSIVGPVTIQAPSGGNTVSGSVTFTGTPSGPLYVGFADQSSGNFYGEYIANPVSTGSAYSIQVPNGTNYFFFGVLDQNNNGVIDTGDISDTESGNGGNGSTAISGPTPNENLALPSSFAVANVATQNYQSSFSSGTSQNYNLSFQVKGQVKTPVAVTLISGPDLINPIDIGLCGAPGNNCGQGFQIYFPIGSNTPSIGDTYTFSVTYSDGTTGTLTAAVTAVLNVFPTNLSPQTGTSSSTQPTFSWTDPANASSYTYQFSLSDSNNNTIWQIPSNNSKSNGFSSSITSIAWITSSNPTDILGDNNPPTVNNLSTSTTYTWGIQLQDSNGNSAQMQVQYQP